MKSRNLLTKKQKKRNTKWMYTLITLVCLYVVYKYMFEEENLADVFRGIYDKNRSVGGPGWPTRQSVVETSNIIYSVIREFEIKSMLDAPCGSFEWMPQLLTNISDEFQARNQTFLYHGVDVVDSVLDATMNNYRDRLDVWKFSRVDFTRESLPSGYDLILSRDALQHLSYQEIINALREFSQVDGAKYLLVGSYLVDSGNKDIRTGGYFPVDLTKPPFNLHSFLRVYSEHNPRDAFQLGYNQSEHRKHLILYDIPNYLRYVDFSRMEAQLKYDMAYFMNLLWYALLIGAAYKVLGFIYKHTCEDSNERVLPIIIKM